MQANFLELKNLIMMVGMSTKFDALQKEVELLNLKISNSIPQHNAPQQYPLPRQHQILQQYPAPQQYHPTFRMSYPLFPIQTGFSPRIMVLNIQCFNPSAHSSGHWKVHELIGYLENQRLKGHLYPFILIALTETWRNSYHHDAQLTMPGYSLCRSDRSNRKGGGVLLYTDSDTLDSIVYTDTC